MVFSQVKISNSHSLYIKSIIDTGCPFTFISESDLKKTRIPFTNYKIVNTVQLGQFAINIINLSENTCFIFRDVNNKLVKVKHKIYGGILANNRSYNPSFILPNIIGLDFLKEKKVNMRFGQNYLTIDDGVTS